MTTLEVALIIITIAGALCGATYKTYKTVKKVDDVSSRPYPCPDVVDVKNELAIIAKDNEKRFNSLEKTLSEHQTQIDLINKDISVVNQNMGKLQEEIKDVSKKIDQILMILINEKKEA